MSPEDRSGLGTAGRGFDVLHGHDLADMGLQVSPRWDDGRQNAIWSRVLHTRRVRDRRFRAAWGAGAVVLGVVLALIVPRWFFASTSELGAVADGHPTSAPGAVGDGAGSQASESTAALAVGEAQAAIERVRPTGTSADEMASVARKPAGLRLRLNDGSRVDGVVGGTVVEPLHTSAHLVRVALRSGAARFVVTRNPKRRFEVKADAATVTVLGTVFTVHLENDVVAVSVDEGLVEVTGPGATLRLRAGERGSVPRKPLDDETAKPLSRTAGPAGASAVDAKDDVDDIPTTSVDSLESFIVDEDDEAPADSLDNGVEPRRPHWFSWRELAQRGDYAAAYDRMQLAGTASVRDVPADLLLAADVARLSGHPGQAVAPLQKILSAHRGDPRAGLASFTLGRVLLDQLSRPGDAALAFVQARQLAPQGALAEDALAREVESWARAGDLPAAQRSARLFLRSYPSSPRVSAVSRWAQLD